MIFFGMKREQEELNLRVKGVRLFSFQVMDHCYPHELRRLLELVKPGTAIPVHTEAPDLVHELIGRLSA